jgi:hypothetical protein
MERAAGGFSEQWAALSAHVFSEMEAWRAQHLRATLQEIEAELDGRLAEGRPARGGTGAVTGAPRPAERGNGMERVPHVQQDELGARGTRGQRQGRAVHSAAAF